MRVHKKLRHAEVDQMIEGESDERLLKNRRERFGQIVRERP